VPCFKFEFGNSTVGPLGMVARVTAPDKATALRLLQERIENAYPGQDVNLHLGDAPVEYVNVYVNAEAMTLDDIDDDETEDDDNLPDDRPGLDRRNPDHNLRVADNSDAA